MRPRRQQPGRRHLVTRVNRVQVASEGTHDREPLSPPAAPAVRGQGRPGDGVLRRDGVGADCVQVANEVGEEQLGACQLEAQRPADAEIAVELGVKVAHDAAPGQGKARLRSRSLSTLA